MKKCFVLMLLLLLITGCGSMNLDKAIGDFTKSVESSKSYHLDGTMEINSGEETFTYNIDVAFLKDDYYKVILVNQTNNHEQVILKNKEGLYVVTPSLNKSFKFDSVWPENSSQSYLLKNLVEDIKNDPEAMFEENDQGYVIKTKVNYPNNEELAYQKMFFDKDMKINKVEVYNLDDIVQIRVMFKNVDLKAKYKDSDFELSKLIKEDSKKEDKCEGENCDAKTMLTIENVVYPLYIPANTHLSGNETIDTEEGNRIILTFGGEKNFVLVEETVAVNDELEIIPVFGDPLMLNETIGAMSNNSISWDNGNISYYLVSSNLSSSELVNVAKSLTGTKSVMSNK